MSWDRGPPTARPPTAGRLGPSALAVAMWLGRLIVAIPAAEVLVAPHPRRLRGAITAFAGGSRTVTDLSMPSAPRERTDIAEAMQRMMETILRDEAGLEDALHHKEVLLRAVHHRVKNNLKLIASIMNLQNRAARTSEARNTPGISPAEPPAEPERCRSDRVRAGLAGAPPAASDPAKGYPMLRGALLWLIGLPIPIIIILFLLDII